MTTIPHRELRNHSGDVLRRAEAGEVFTITADGRPVACLGPIPRTTWVRGTRVATVFAAQASRSPDPDFWSDVWGPRDEPSAVAPVASDGAAPPTIPAPAPLGSSAGDAAALSPSRRAARGDAGAHTRRRRGREVARRMLLDTSALLALDREPERAEGLADFDLGVSVISLAELHTAVLRCASDEARQARLTRVGLVESLFEAQSVTTAAARALAALPLAPHRGDAPATPIAAWGQTRCVAATAIAAQAPLCTEDPERYAGLDAVLTISRLP